MEDGGQVANAADEAAATTTTAAAAPSQSPPPPPDPSKDAPVTDPAVESAHKSKSDKPLHLTQEAWDITTISPLAAVQMLIQALEPLAEATGDIPPTPPVSRPTTPRKEAPDPLLQRVSSPADAPPITIGSPEAHPHEPIPTIGAGAEDITMQHAAIARRFFSKVPPPFSLAEYLLRLHKYCEHSPSVYLAAASYCYRLCVSDLMIPATSRTIHRLALAAIRVAAKALEDNKWSQSRMATVGGVSKTQLMNLEVSLCFLLDFDLWVDAGVLARGMFRLQQAGLGMGARSGKMLNDQFKLKLPHRRKLARAAAVG